MTETKAADQFLPQCHEPTIKIELVACVPDWFHNSASDIDELYHKVSGALNEIGYAVHEWSVTV